MLTQKAIKELRKIAGQIKSHPKQFVMSTWIVGENNIITENDEKESCGTAGCIAGWVYFNAHCSERKTLSDTYTDWVAPRRSGEGYADDVEAYAIQKLGLDKLEAMRLFRVDYWPDPYKSLYKGYSRAQDQGNLTYEERCQNAEVAAKRIEYFIETDGRE